MNDDQKAEWINGPAAMAAEIVAQQRSEAIKKELDEMLAGGKRCPKCDGQMVHYGLYGYRCAKGCCP